MAGELRRYWSLAATLSLGTGAGPAHPAVEAVAATLVLPLVVLRGLTALLPDDDGSRLLATAVAAVVLFLCVRQTRLAVRESRRPHGD